MSTIVPRGVSRREFMSRIVGAWGVLGPAILHGRESLGLGDGSSEHETSTILLWMSGGPSTIDLWDLKPGTATGGPFQPISTSGEGQICEHLPMLARQMHHFAVIRSMSTSETDHERASRLLRNGRWPCRTLVGAGDDLRTRDLHAWHVDRAPRAVRQRYGENDFGRGCLRARQLVEQQVPQVEVRLGGWDSHHEIFSTLKDRQLPVLDRAMSALVEDLERRGLLPRTLIVWMGEFGRTPRVNSDGGRDHWARAWSVVLGGAGIRGGSVIGQTSRDGTRVESEPYAGPDLLATIRRAQAVTPHSAIHDRAGHVISPVLV